MSSMSVAFIGKLDTFLSPKTLIWNLPFIQAIIKKVECKKISKSQNGHCYGPEEKETSNWRKFEKRAQKNHEASSNEDLWSA